MARHEHRREDLIREAVALRQRAALAVPSLLAGDEVTIGIRASGALSLYLGEDPAWHLNPQRQLRRAFRQGRLLKAEAGRLVELERVRTDDVVELRRRVLTDDEQVAVLQEVQTHVMQLAHAIARTEAQLLRAAGDPLPTLADVSAWLAPFVESRIHVAQEPNA